jgi:hypothetical protein
MAKAEKPARHKSILEEATSADQRRFHRFGVKLACRVKPRKSQESAEHPELSVETSDVSRGGLFFMASPGLTVGTALDFVLDIPDNVVSRPVRIRCQGVITRVVPQEGGRVGIGATIDRYRITPVMDASGDGKETALPLRTEVSN